LNDFTDGGCIKDIICPCLSFVVLITTDGGLVSIYKVITCSLDKPLDVTCLDDTTVAVSTYNGIEIININSTKNERVIETSEPCDGITHHNGVLVWCECERGKYHFTIRTNDASSYLNVVFPFWYIKCSM
jgi:hypothetical protein